jgi:hypothetical protein
MSVITYNCSDLGNASGWMDLPFCSESHSRQAYGMDLKFIIFSMSH